MHKKEQKTTSKTEREDDNNFLHRGESVAAYLFYCSTAKVQYSWSHYFLNRMEKNSISTLVIGYNHRMSWDMGILITYCVTYAA
jgi:hypothetical protein